jgi:uncharacterized protein with PIN domain
MIGKKYNKSLVLLEKKMDKKQYEKIRKFILEENDRKNSCQCRDRSYSQDEIDNIVSIKYIHEIPIYKQNRTYNVYICKKCGKYYNDGEVALG